MIHIHCHSVLTLEQTERDIEASQSNVEEARESVQTFIKELKALEKQQAERQVRIIK